MDYRTMYAALRELRNEAWGPNANAGIIGDKIDDLITKLYDIEIKRLLGGKKDD